MKLSVLTMSTLLVWKTRAVSSLAQQNAKRSHEVIQSISGWAMPITNVWKETDQTIGPAITLKYIGEHVKLPKWNCDIYRKRAWCRSSQKVSSKAKQVVQFGPFGYRLSTYVLKIRLPIQCETLLRNSSYFLEQLRSDGENSTLKIMLVLVGAFDFRLTFSASRTNIKLQDLLVRWARCPPTKIDFAKIIWPSLLSLCRQAARGICCNHA